MARLFSAYVIVDWSAASKPTTGADSIWIGVFKRDVRFRLTFESFNEATRTAAEARLNSLLADFKKRSERALVGFDFPLGFPRGFASALKLKDARAAWRAAWDELDRTTGRRQAHQRQQPLRRGGRDQPTVDRSAPVHRGCSPKDATRSTLQPKKTRDQGPGDLPELPPVRGSEARHGLRDLADRITPAPSAVRRSWGCRRRGASSPARRRRQRVWPFETGFKALTEADPGGRGRWCWPRSTVADQAAGRGRRGMKDYRSRCAPVPSTSRAWTKPTS